MVVIKLILILKTIKPSKSTYFHLSFPYLIGDLRQLITKRHKARHDNVHFKFSRLFTYLEDVKFATMYLIVKTITEDLMGHFTPTKGCT